MEYAFLKSSENAVKSNRQALLDLCWPLINEEPQVPGPNDPSRRKWANNRPSLLPWLKQLPAGTQLSEAVTKGWLKYEPAGTYKAKEDEIRTQKHLNGPGAAEQITHFLYYIRLGAEQRWPRIFWRATELLRGICGDERTVKPTFTPMDLIDFSSAKMFLDDMHIAYLRCTTMIFFRVRLDELLRPLVKLSNRTAADFYSARDELFYLEGHVYPTVEQLVTERGIEGVGYGQLVAFDRLRREVSIAMIHAEEVVNEARQVKRLVDHRLRRLTEAVKHSSGQAEREQRALYDKPFLVPEMRGEKAQAMLKIARREMDRLAEDHSRRMCDIYKDIALTRYKLAAPGDAIRERSLRFMATAEALGAVPPPYSPPESPSTHPKTCPPLHEGEYENTRTVTEEDAKNAIRTIFAFQKSNPGFEIAKLLHELKLESR